MNTKPILFSTEMVQAILEGRKTQTRRTKGLKVVNDNPDSHLFNSFSIDNDNATFKRLEGMWQGVDVPFKTGDVLWVRESFAKVEFKDQPTLYLYKANPEHQSMKWKPSIHMPKEACRLFLKVTNVRVERLQDITEMDAIFEGCMQYEKDTDWMTALYGFELLWKKINGESSWKSNPWVWVIDFERIEKPENF